VFLDDCAGYDTNIEFFCKGLVGFQIFLRLGAEIDEVWIVWKPVRKVVFRENGEMGALRSSVADEGDGFSVVGFYCHGFGV